MSARLFSEHIVGNAVALAAGETPRPGRCGPAGALLSLVVQRASAAAEPAGQDAADAA